MLQLRESSLEMIEMRVLYKKNITTSGVFLFFFSVYLPEAIFKTLIPREVSQKKLLFTNMLQIRVNASKCE